MIVGVGVDLASVARLRESMSRHDGRFETRVFTDDERHYCSSRARAAEHFAARFAAKEATWKALGLDGGLPWREIEVVSLPSGAPTLRLHGRTAERATERGVARLHVSLSHTDDNAIAMVIAETAAL